jgi:hypothetical protein
MEVGAAVWRTISAPRSRRACSTRTHAPCNIPDGIERFAGRVTLRQRVTFLGPTGKEVIFILLILALMMRRSQPIDLKTKRIGQKEVRRC